MSARNHFIFWALAFIVLLGFVYVFSGVLLPFVLGIAIAYLLNPLVNALGKIKIARGIAAMLILVIFFAFVGGAFALIAPILYKQSLQLAEDIPGYFEAVTAFIEPYAQKAAALVGSDNTEITEFLKSQTGTAAGVAKKLLSSLAAGGAAVFDLISVFVLTPIVAYFMMKEWIKICEWVEDKLPRDNKKTILNLLSEVDVKISGFVRGQISVAFILALAYSIGLTIAGLNYGFLIGLVAGLISVIPMVGSAVGLVISVAVAWFQAGELVYVAIIAAIFLAGQLIEGNILSPKIVGDSVGLHPLWVFFALMAGGSLFGILGMLIAVPIAATAGVLLAFAIDQYKASPYYKSSKSLKKKSA
ncbi:MAG: AI-2E family transporter [Pseudomonadota bacterium]